MNNIRIKVCGLTRLEDLKAVGAMGVHYAGFIFHEESPRFVRNKLDPEAVKNYSVLEKVGVFVNAKEDYILKQAARYGLNILQLHGQEPPEVCQRLRKQFPIIKAFHIQSIEDYKTIMNYETVCDFFLFDTPGPLHGGNGQTFNWQLLEHYKGTTPFFLSGGIGLNEVKKIKEFHHPACKVIDVNSRFETRPGEKNTADLKQFLWDLNIS